MGGDGSRAHQGLGVCRFHLQVIEQPLVNHIRLRRGHPLDAISRPAATALSHLTPTHNTTSRPRALCHRRDTGHPGRLQRPEVRPDAHLAIRREHDPPVRRPHLRGHSVDERITPER
jgi:hypothetical protein